VTADHVDVTLDVLGRLGPARPGPGATQQQYRLYVNRFAQALRCVAASHAASQTAPAGITAPATAP